MTQPLISSEHTSSFVFNIVEPRSSLHQQKTTTINETKRFTTCQLLINDIIKDAQYSMLKIASETGIPLVSLRRLRSGRTKEPRSSAFDRIFSLYCKVCLCKIQE